jgi:hypothetical protein
LGFYIDDNLDVRQVTVPSCFNTADSPLRDYQGTVWFERDFVVPAYERGNSASSFASTFS